MSGPYEHDARTAQSIHALRKRIANDAGAVMIFLGAGLSFGVGRFLGRGSFEIPPPIPDDDRFPSWPLLIDRMRGELVASVSDEHERRCLERFIGDHDPLDAAQLYRLRVSRERYHEFLRSQFATHPDDVHFLTPSHEALVRLPVRELFTTNYDALIELAFERHGEPLVVSTTPDEFLRAAAAHPARHLIKLHGTWDQPERIVLTRDDYARSRVERVEMFRHLAQVSRFSTFLFVGFSLADPNFNLIRDEARLAMGDAMPTSYLVQQQLDSVTRSYLNSLNVETIELFSWNELPRFLRDINPGY
jgi:hypothetical protein